MAASLIHGPRVGISRLGEMKARFQQRQLQEKEEKLLRLYENQQQRTLERVQGRNNTPVGGDISPGELSSGNSSIGSLGGRVRQMFDERRSNNHPNRIAGIDKSYPLDPIQNIPMQKLPNVGKQLPSERLQAKTMVKQNVSKGRGFAPTRSRNDGISSTSNTEISSNKTGPTKRFTEKKAIGSGDYKKTIVSSTPKSVSTGILNDEKSHSSEKTSASSRTSKVKIEPESSTKKMQKNSGKSPASSAQRQSVRSRITDSQNASSVSRDDLLPCKYCNRRFASDRLGVHQEICARTAQKKRKPYDALKHRVVGTEAEIYVRKAVRSKSVSQPQALKKNDWRKKHEDFIQAIRAAKQMQAHIAAGGKLSDLPPPVPSSNPDYVQCPHCGRRFNEAAAERHIPKCANYSFNKPNPAAANASRGRKK